MTELIGPKRLKDLFARHGVRPRKALGQNFVIDPNTIRKVVDIAHLSGDERVLEIGPGAGSLTIALAEAAAHVTALEVDERLIPVLDEVLAGLSNVTLVRGDALVERLGGFGADRVVANLPYNVATPVVLRILEQAPEVRELVVMTQKEVGERLAAEPGSKIYGAPTVTTAFFAEARVAARVSRRAFWPVPNVDSVLVRVTRRDLDSSVDFAPFVTVVRAAFGQRRKSLRNSLADVAGGVARSEEALRSVGVDPASRPEQLPCELFQRVAQAIFED